MRLAEAVTVTIRLGIVQFFSQPAQLPRNHSVNQFRRHTEISMDAVLYCSENVENCNMRVCFSNLHKECFSKCELGRVI